jgi:stage III sporulation protein AD
MIKIIVLSIIGCCISVIIKQYCKELILPFYIAFAIGVISLIFDKYSTEISVFTDIIKSMKTGNEVVSVLIKASLISVFVKISGDICKDSGNVLMQDLIEFGGRVVIFTLSLPYIVQIIKICFGLLK